MTASGPRLVVLGIAQDGGHPQAGCTRPCCEAAWAGREPGHRVAALGLVDGARRWMVDCTPDFPTQLQALGGPPLEGILLTHAHMGHYTGLLHVGPESWAPRDLPVYVMPGMRAFLEQNAPWQALMTDGHVELRDLTADVEVALTDRLRVVPREVPHRGPWSETVAFEIRGPRSTVLYVPDIDAWTGAFDLAERIPHVDCAYVDGTFFDEGELPWRDRSKVSHPLLRETMDRLQGLPDRLRARVRFLHLNHTNPVLRAGSEAYRQVHDRGFAVASEGEEVEL